MRRLSKPIEAFFWALWTYLATYRVRGGWTESLRGRVDYQIHRHWRINETAKHSRRKPHVKVLRRLLANKPFSRFIVLYILASAIWVGAINVLPGISAAIAQTAGHELSALLRPISPLTNPIWLLLDAYLSIETDPSNGAGDWFASTVGHMISAQVGALGLIAIAVAVVTLIVQRKSGSPDVRIYYHEALVFELVASSLALLTVLSAQLLLPPHEVIHKAGWALTLAPTKLALTVLHVVWLLTNLFAIAYFITLTFRFVQQSERTKIRINYLANALAPNEIKDALMLDSYGNLTRTDIHSKKFEEGSVRPSIFFGDFLLEKGDTELEHDFRSPTELYDVRVSWVRWALASWSNRCQSRADQPNNKLRLIFTPRIGGILDGQVAWCQSAGGMSLRWWERQLLKRAFRFRTQDVSNDRHSITTANLLEDFAAEVTDQIDRESPAAFDAAVREMTDHHRFLLALYSARSPDDVVSNFAEAKIGYFGTIQEDWSGQYDKPFRHAIERIQDDSHYAATLSYVPMALIRADKDNALTATCANAILDLGPRFVRHLEAWVAKKTVVESQPGKTPIERLSLAGSNASAYEGVLRRTIGAWESLTYQNPAVGSWRNFKRGSSVDQWAAYRASWPILWRHLENTALFLALAVWNEDETGAHMYREALLRWPQNFDFLVDDEGYSTAPGLLSLFPNLIYLDWPDVRSFVIRVTFPQNQPTPGDIFKALIKRAHGDLITLAASLFLHWAMTKEQASGLSSLEALALFEGKRHRSHDDEDNTSSPLTYYDMFRIVLRFRLAGEHFDDHSYGHTLDGVIERLDLMTERREVLGRSYTPSTLSGRDGLLESMTAILLSLKPTAQDENIPQKLKKLALEDQQLPSGDQSLESIVEQLKHLEHLVNVGSARLESGARILDPDIDYSVPTKKLQDLVGESIRQIESVRHERILRRPIDEEKLSATQEAVEEALLIAPAGIRIFHGFDVRRLYDQGKGRELEVDLGPRRRAEIIDPPMADLLPDANAHAQRQANSNSNRHALFEFSRLPREPQYIPIIPENRDFWRMVIELARQVGPSPILYLSGSDKLRPFHQMVHLPGSDKLGLQIHVKPREKTARRYVGTIEGIDVFIENIDAGTAWLFSGQLLKEVTYYPLQGEQFVSVEYSPDDDINGRLIGRFRQALSWEEWPVFELRQPKQGGEDS